jgi:lia operon protein LiaG
MKGPSNRIVLVVSAIAAVSLGIAVVLFFTTTTNLFGQPGGRLSVEQRRSFPLEGIAEINVRSSSTDVVIGKTQGGTVDLYLHGTVRSSRPGAAPELLAERSGRSLMISTDRRNVVVLGFFSSNLVLEIGVPEQYAGALVVHTSSGDVDITGQDLSALSVETSSGDMRLSSLQASTLSMKSSSGDQTVNGLGAGLAEFGSSSGDILVENLQGGARAESSSGSITLRFREFSSDVEVQSSSGDVELYLTGSAQFRLEARSSSGDIDCAFPLTLSGASSEIRRNRMVATVGEGTHRVVVQTSSGDITIAP